MRKFCTNRSEGNRLSQYPWWLLLLILGGIHSALNAQEYRLEWGGIASVNSYLGDANRVIPFASVGGGVGAQMRYNHNFRIAFSGDLSYNYIHGNSRIRNQVYPQQTSKINFAAHALLLSIKGEYNFFAYSDKYPFLHTRRWSPYLALGLSVGAAFGKDAHTFMPGIEGALGIKYKIANRLNLIASLGGRQFFTDRLDALSNESSFLSNPYRLQSSWYKGGDGMLLITLGFTYEFSSRGSSCNINEQIAR